MCCIASSSGKNELVDHAFNSFKRDVSIIGGRYMSGFPWKKGSTDHLFDDEQLA